jgi:hypothetical protein
VDVTQIEGEDRRDGSERDWAQAPLLIVLCIFAVRCGWDFPMAPGSSRSYLVFLDSVGVAIAALGLAYRTRGARAVLAKLGSIACVLAILSAALHPVIRQAQQSAEETTCLTSLKSLSLSMLFYSSDFDDRLPRSDDWRTVTLPYGEFGDRGMRCPNSEAPYTYAMNKAASGSLTTGGRETDSLVMIFDADSESVDLAGGKELAVARHAGRTGMSSVDCVVHFGLSSSFRWQP